MTLYKFGILLTVIHLLAGGVGTIIVQNLTSYTGQATYGGSSGFLPGDDSPYSAFGNFLYGDDEPEPGQIGEDAGGLGLARYGLTEGICVMSNSVKWVIIISSFAYPSVDIIPMDGFGLWIRLLIHLVSVGASVFVMFQLVQMLAGWGVFSNIYIMVAVGLISSAGLLSTILAEATGISC